MRIESSISRQYRSRLLDLFGEISLVRLDETRKKKNRFRRVQPDFTVNVFVGEDAWEILGETKVSGEPRIIRGAIQQLQGELSTSPRTYGIIAAPYIGPRSQEICKEAGIGYLDLAGNCRLVFGQLYVERKGFLKPKVEQRPLRTLFAPKAGRVLRVLLEDPKRAWLVQMMAREAKVSLGLAFKVKQRLLDLEYAQEGQRGLRVAQPENLLREWAANYAFSKSSACECFALGEVPELERALARYCRSRRIAYAFTLFSGAARVAPFTRYARGSAYVLASPEKVASELGWKSVSTGANFTLLRPFDEGLLYGAQDVQGDRVVSDVQLYLDLVGYKGRGEEAATFLLGRRLRPRW